METKMKNLTRRICIGIAGAAAIVALGTGVAMAATPPADKTLPASASKTVNVAPMALPANACGGIRQNTLFLPLGASISTAQLQSTFGVAVRDTSRTMHQAPGAGPRIWQSGNTWSSSTNTATALLESTTAFESRQYFQVVWQPC
jgi:hypothetical protein